MVNQGRDEQVCTAEVVRLEVKLQGKRKVKMRYAQSRFTGSYRPLENPKAERKLMIAAEFEEGTISGVATETAVRVGTMKTGPGEIRLIENGKTPKVSVVGHDVMPKPVAGIEDVKIDLGGTTVTVDLTKARRVSIAPTAC